MYDTVYSVSMYGLFVSGIFLLLLALFAPAVIAAMRGHPNAAPIFLVVLFFGWTTIGWLIALVWSFSAIQEDRPVIVKNYNGRSRPRARRRYAG